MPSARLLQPRPLRRHVGSSLRGCGMRTRYRATTFAGALALSAVAAVADDNMRCGNAIIDVGMVAAQVVDRCGEPKSKVVEDVPIRQRTKSGGVNTIGSARIERW